MGKITGCLVVLLLAVSLAAQSVANNKAWTSQWITAPGVPERDEVVLYFRKVIEQAQPPQHFVVQVSADNQFILYLNGQRVGNGPSRSDLAHWRYETYDLAPFLHAGMNVLAATVWNFGTHAPIAQMSSRVAFLLQGENEPAVDTDSSWEVEQEKGITTMRPEIHGYYAAEPGERIDASRIDSSSLTDSSDHAGSWAQAITLGRAVLREGRDAPNNWQLVADPLPQMEMTPSSPGHIVRANIALPSAAVEKEFVVPAHTKAEILVDNGELTTAYPVLTVSDGAGSTIRLTYAEALLDDKRNKGNRNQIEGKHIEGIFDEFLADGALSREFMPLSWRTWRYLQLDIQTADQPLRFLRLRSWFTAYPFVDRAYFRSDDSSLVPIWDIGWRTARLDAHDTYMDTPYWERLQYIGDTRIQALISYAVAGDDRLARQAIDAFNNSRIPDGLTQSRYPSSLVQMIPTFSLLWIGMVHDFWIYRGDVAFVRAQLPGARAVLNWFLRHQRADGLLGKIPWWPFLDWGKDFQGGSPPQDDDGGSASITMQFIEALRYSAELESFYGDAHFADLYRSAAQRAAQGVKKLCWNQQYGLFADTPAQQHYSQHANILGVWLDLIPGEQQKDVLNKILSTSDSRFRTTAFVPSMTSATYYFRFYLARALEHAGMGDEYLQLLGPWHEMVSLGLTTWAESPEPTRSDSHAWSAHPNYDLLTIVAGIHPKAAGFETVSIEPHLGELKHLEAAEPTPKGMVEVKYSRVSNRLEAEINLSGVVSGELLWKGQKMALHAGEQRLTLP